MTPCVLSYCSLVIWFVEPAVAGSQLEVISQCNISFIIGQIYNIAASIEYVLVEEFRQTATT